MHETTGAGFAAEDYQNIKYCCDIGTQKFWKGTDSQNFSFTGCLLENIIHKAAFEQED